jgi:hypothetical protein
MRHLALLLCAALVGCATSAPITTKPAAEPDPAVDIAALLERDGLIAFDEAEVEQLMGSGRKALLSTGFYELDGEAPRELIIHTNEYTGEGTWSETLWIYDVSDAAAPRALLTPTPRAPHTAPRAHGGLSWGSYMDQGWWRADDLDGDGRAEIVIMGHTDGVAPAPLLVLGWGRAAAVEGVIDKLWRDPEGVEVVAADVDGDGRRELVSIIAPLPDVVAPTRLVALKPDAEGRWREVTLDVDAALPVVLDALLDGHPRVYHALPRVVELMRARKVAPRDVKALQRKIEARLATRSAEESELQADLRWYSEAMAWPGNVRAYEALLPYLSQPFAASPVAGALLELDAQTGQTRGREALIAWLKAALMRGVTMADGLSESMEIGEVLRSLDERGIEEGALLAVARIVDADAPHMVRADLLLHATPYLDKHLARLSSLWAEGGDDELAQQLLATILVEAASYMPRHKRWRAAIKVEQARAWLTRPALAESAAGLREEVWARLDREGAPDVRASLIYGASEALTPVPPLERVLRWQTRWTDVDRDALWGWVIMEGEPALILTLLEQAQTGPELQRAVEALAAPEVPCDRRYGEPVGCTGLRGKLLGSLPELHKLLAARLASRDQDMRAAAIAVMTHMPYEPTQRLLVDLARAPGEPLAVLARAAVTVVGHRSVQDYLFDEVSRVGDSEVFAALGRAMDAGGAQRLLDWLAGYISSGAEADAERRALVFSWAVWALAVAAPAECPQQRSLLESMIDDGGHTCDVRAAAAATLALCEPSWLAQVASDARLDACEGELLNAAMNHVGERGIAAHLPALERLAEDPRSRYIREYAHRAALKIKARVAPKP